MRLPGLVRAILAEALGLSASALGGVQVVLTGACDTVTDQPAGAPRAGPETAAQVTRLAAASAFDRAPRSPVARGQSPAPMCCQLPCHRLANP